MQLAAIHLQYHYTNNTSLCCLRVF